MDGFGKIALGIRCGDRGVDPVTFKCWQELILSGVRDGDAVLPPAIELPHHWAANLLADTFLRDTECDTLLMVDDDMTFPPDALSRLRDNEHNHAFSIVQGLCVTRRGGHGPIVLVDAEDGHTAHYLPTEQDHTVEVGMVGLAFTLIRRKALEDVAARQSRGLLFRWGEDGTGEDRTFCKAARAAGHMIGVDTRLVIGHRFPVDVYWSVAAKHPGYQTFKHSRFLRLLQDLDEKTKQGD